MKRLSSTLAVLFALAASAVLAADAEPLRVLPSGKLPEDSRLTKVRTLNDKDFFLKVPATKEAWEARRQEVREQMLVANGLWPMPKGTPLNPVIHGKIDRDEYTIEKVFFASYPGHYVCGNLYRPKGKTGPLPAVLCPHGHWRDGRFFDAGEKEAQNQMKQGAEKTIAGARYPLQARCAMLARMGCVVFHYDMVGYADSMQIAHRAGFTDAEAELRLQSFMGLQTWNSICALDFLMGLPDVDPKRIGVTGASGGGTQTFILCGIDDRPAVAFPAVMVSTAMQGGCICENCSYLRQGTGNIELAGLFAPKPLGMSGARDWTIDIETKGLPELKALYKLLGAEDKVMAKCLPEFGHNYNQVSRELMYNWFNKHLQLGHKEPVEEKPFEPVPPKELSVFDAAHPVPKDAVGAQQLRKYLTESSDRQLQSLFQPISDKFPRVVGTALRAMINDRLPDASAVEARQPAPDGQVDGVTFRPLLLGRTGQGEQVPATLLRPKDFDGTVVVWIHPEGKSSLIQNGKLAPAARQILDKKAAVLAVDVLLTGESREAKLPPVNAGYAGYTFGYNRPLLANRVHDILTAVAHAKGQDKVKAVHLVGFEKAGPWVVLARALCGKAVSRTAADFDQFRFDKITTTGDEMMLPGALKYGGLPAFATVCAPCEMYLHNVPDCKPGELDWFGAGYWDERLQRRPARVPPEKVVAWLLR